MDGNYVAMTVTLVVWFGIFLFLRSLSKRVSRLEKGGR
jgi:CcmD family protein